MPLSVQPARLAATVPAGARAGASGAGAAVSPEEQREEAELSRVAELKRAEATLERLKAEVRSEFERKLSRSIAHDLLELPFVEAASSNLGVSDARALCRVAASLERGYVEAARRFNFELSGQLLRDLREAGGIEDRPIVVPGSPRIGELAIRPVAQTPP